MSSLLFFLELELRIPPPTVFLALLWDARMACLHVFRCISPLLLVFCRGILVILFKRYLSSVLVVPLPQGLVLCGHVSTSSALSIDRAWVP